MFKWNGTKTTQTSGLTPARTEDQSGTSLKTKPTQRAQWTSWWDSSVHSVQIHRCPVHQEQPLQEQFRTENLQLMLSKSFLICKRLHFTSPEEWLMSLTIYALFSFCMFGIYIVGFLPILAQTGQLSSRTFTPFLERWKPTWWKTTALHCHISKTRIWEVGEQLECNFVAFSVLKGYCYHKKYVRC